MCSVYHSARNTNGAMLGRQHIGSYINIVAYYGIAMPISVTCSFTLGWRLMGLWCGVAIALAVVSSLQSFIILKTNWDKVWALTSYTPSSDCTMLT